MALRLGAIITGPARRLCALNLYLTGSTLIPTTIFLHETSRGCRLLYRMGPIFQSIKFINNHYHTHKSYEEDIKVHHAIIDPQQQYLL